MDPLVLLVAGLIAGWLAGLFMKGRGYGLIGDIGVAVVGGAVGAWLFILIVPAAKASGFGLCGDLGRGLGGAIVGGWLFGVVWSPAEPVGFFRSIIVASVGAVILILVARAVGAGRTARA